MPENIESLDIQIWVNKLAKQSVKSVASGVKKSKKDIPRILELSSINSMIFSILE
ncbi:Integrase [Streptococcus agalactiae]|nr:Integrase [Streptococcus agalactiae]